MLMDAEDRAAIQQPHKMPEAGLGVLVEHRVSAEKAAIPGSADFEVAHRDRDVVDRWESHGLTLRAGLSMGPV